jgi:hypothetical protein
MTTLHGIEIKVGDKVWDLRYGWSEVISLRDGESYEIVTHINTYTIDGKCSIGNQFPSLFWNEFEVPKEAFIKPLPKLAVDTKVMVWEKGKPERYRRYFSHFDEEGRMHCFIKGLTNWTSDSRKTSPWDYWKLFEENSDD